MDITDALDLQFLDLSEVDDAEKRWVLASLHSNRQNTDLPWFIGDERAIFGVTKGKVKKPQYQSTSPSLPVLENNYVQNAVISHQYSVPVQAAAVALPINNQYYNVPPYVQPVAAVYSNYISPTFPVKPPVFYGVPPTQQIFNPHSNSTHYENNSIDYVQKPAFSPPHKAEEIQPEPIKDDDKVTTIVQSNVLGDDVPATVENKKPQNEVHATPSPMGKSWASLFSSKTESTVNTSLNGTSQTSKPVVNQVASTDPVKEESSCPFKNPKKNQFVDPDCYRMGEFLTSHAVDGRAISLQPRGLTNQSNYCYINSILQALIACPPMYNLLHGLSQNISSNEKRKPTPVIDGMCKFIKEFSHLPANMRVSNRRSDGKNQQRKDQGVIINTDTSFEPAWIYKMLNGIRTDLIEGRQEDAEEFLCFLLNNLNDEMLELMKLIKTDDEKPMNVEQNHDATDDEGREWQLMGPKNKGSVARETVLEKTPITDIFGGSLKSKIQRTGDTVTENTQPFFTLQLNIEKVKTVREALEALTTKYQLEGLTSSKTNEEVEAWQQVMLNELPIILILHLKCFDFKPEGCTKIVKALEFPIDLKIDSKLLSSKTLNPKEKQYKLFAVVYHDGKEATKGHYITDAFHVGYSSWLRYDDSTVKPVQEEHVLKPQGLRVPYLLFYRRSDTIRR